MTIYGLSQSSSVERRLKIERGGQGIVLTFIDLVGNKEREKIMVQAGDLMAAVTSAPPGGSKVEGVSPPHGEKMQLDLDVRGNEVLLLARGSGAGTDVAVGLDDFMDALGTAVGRE
jgi:hypothetical protein